MPVGAGPFFFMIDWSGFSMWRPFAQRSWRRKQPFCPSPTLQLSIGAQKGPPVGVQKGPLCGAA
jgi:hypothetical protein